MLRKGIHRRPDTAWQTKKTAPKPYAINGLQSRTGILVPILMTWSYYLNLLAANKDLKAKDYVALYSRHIQYKDLI